MPEDVTIPINKMISTFVLKVKGDKYVILNIIEGEDFRIEKSIPLNGLGIDLSKCTQVNIKVNPEANGGFEVESDLGKSYYQGIEVGGVTNSGSGYYKGEFKEINYVVLQDITDITQVKGFQEALFPLRKLITLENHFQAILQGLLSAQEGVEVLTEPNYSSRGKPDLLTSHRGKDGEIRVAAVELKLASTEEGIEKKRKEGKDQLEKRADGLETITKEEKVEAAVLVVFPSAEDKDKFITHFREEDLNVGHSSRGSSDGEPSPQKKQKCSEERKKRSIGKSCIDSRDEESAEEKKGIEINEENFDESKIDNEKLRAYQEKIKDEGSEINDQLNRLIVEIQQAQAIKHFSDTCKVIIEKLFPALENIDGMQSENISYFEQMCKLNLLRIISPIIKDVDFKSLLFHNPEKLVKDQSLLENVFASVESLVSDKYKQQQLQYEDFENLENQINEEILNKSGETEGIANQDVSKTDLSNYVFESVGLSLLMGQDIEVSTDLQKRIYYETLINLGALIHDHKNHIQVTHNGNERMQHMRYLVTKIKRSKLLNIANDLYYLRRSEGNESDLRSSEVKSKINLYGSINSEYKLNDIHNKFDIDEIKSHFSEDELKKFGAEFEAYDKEVITIHSPQVFTSGNEVHVKVRDNNGDVKQLIIGSIEDIRNIVNYDYNKETLEIKLKVASDKEYTITCKKRDGEVKYYLNIAGYKTKVGDIIKSFTTQAKGNIRRKLDQLQDKIELLTTKKDIEAMADIEVSDQDYIREVRQNLLAQGVSESTFDRFKEQLDYVNEEVFGRHVSDISEELTKNNIEFNRSKFNTAKVKGAKGNKFFSIMAIYDLFDSLKDVPTLGRHDNDALKRIFGINGILDAVNDVRESLSAVYMHSDGRVVTKIRPDSAVGRIFRKIPLSTRKAFVKVISNSVVESITFATAAYQFGHNIDAIVKGDHHPLNYYFATSNGIKLASMSKPISMGVGAAVKGLSATTKALRVVSGVSKVLGKLSVATAVVDFAVTIGITIHEAGEYVKAIAGKILLSDHEQFELFTERILKAMLWYQLIGGKTPSSDYYEDAIKIKGFLDLILAEGKEILSYSGVVTTVQCLTSVKAGDYNVAAALKYLRKRDNDSLNAYLTSIKNPCDVAAVTQCLASKRSNDGLSAVVQYVISIKDEYSEIIESYRTPRSAAVDCITELKYINSSFGEINSNVGNLSSLDISKVLPLEHSTLDGKEVYFINKDIKHLPRVTLDEYNDGLRFVKAPSGFRASSLICGNVINKKIKYFGYPSTECNNGKVHKKCIKTFNLTGEPFIFTNIERSSSLPILYLSGPRQLVAARNYPAVMHVPKGRVNYKGSEYHDNTFIINYDTHGYITGGTANNTIVMNYNTSDISVRLHTGIIDIADSRIRLVTNIFRHYIYNYISHSTANQNITTGCKTRYVDAGKGGGNNSIQNYDVYCQDEDYEIRKVNKKDIHLRSIKQTIFIVDQSSGSGATISFSNTRSKKNLDVIYVKCFDISQLRINDHQNGYRLDFVAYDEEVKASVRIDSFEKLVAKMGTAVTIVIRDKSLPDIIKDMVRQKLSNTGADIDDKIIENSKKRSKAVIIADITGSENTTAYAVARGIAESSDNLGITVSQIQVIKGDIVLNYAVNDLNKIKLVHNGRASTSDDNRECDRLLLTNLLLVKRDIFKDVLDDCTDVEAKNESGWTFLHLASQKGMLDMAGFLLDRGANIEAEGNNGCTPLHEAVRHNKFNMVKFLVNKGANINVKNAFDRTPLGEADRLSSPEIANFLREKQNERPVQRKRRHHHGDHPHHHSLRKLLATDLSNQPEIAASSANQKSSWINVFANTIVDAVKGISQFISSLFKPAIDMKHSQPSKAITAQGIDTNGTLLLLDVFIRKVTGQKYISNDIRSISEQEAQIYALPIAKEFEQALESAAIESGIPVTNLKFNPVEVFLKVAGQIRSGKFSEISKTLYSSAKEACPEFEQTGEFRVHVKSHLEEFLAKKETVFLQQKQTADQPTSSVSRKVVAMEPSKKPDTFLSDTSVAKGIKHVLGL